MLDDPDATGRRLYESIPDALKFMDEVKTQLRQDFAGDIPEADNDDGDCI